MYGIRHDVLETLESANADIVDCTQKGRDESHMKDVSLQSWRTGFAGNLSRRVPGKTDIIALHRLQCLRIRIVMLLWSCHASRYLGTTMLNCSVLPPLLQAVLLYTLQSLLSYLQPGKQLTRLASVPASAKASALAPQSL